jgi:hypothetical protein
VVIELAPSYVNTIPSANTKWESKHCAVFDPNDQADIQFATHQTDLLNEAIYLIFGRELRAFIGEPSGASATSRIAKWFPSVLSGRCAATLCLRKSDRKIKKRIL